MIWRLSRPTCLVIVALALTAATGCGDERAQVTGRVVRSDGEPVMEARVIARSDNGKSAVGVTKEDGQFELSSAEPGRGIEPGDYSVIIVEDRGRTDNMRPATISAMYADPSLSGLTLSVQAGESKEFDITVDPL